MRYLLLLLLALPLLLGASAGPQVLDDLGQRRFARGPWVSSYESDEFDLACDMTSDTCSYGRKITTTRATPVPCEVAPGQWEMVPEDTGCYSVRGLESWAATTSYLSWGAELTNSAWSGDATVLPLGNVSWVFGSDAASIGQTVGGAASGDWTFTCIMRASDTTTGHTARISVGEASCDAELNPSHNSTGVGWGTYSCSTELEEEGPLTAQIWPQSMVGVDVIGCWLTRTDTPGRACWGGEAPVTCASDRHTISTEGWPTESGEICLTYEDSGEVFTRVLIEGRPNSGSGSGTFLWITGNSYEVNIAGTKIRSNPGAVVEGQPVRVCIGRKAGDGYISVNGVRHNGGPIPPFEWEPIASIGRGRVSQYQGISGSIRSLTVRSYEEVSP